MQLNTSGNGQPGEVNSILTIARDYIARGWHPVPLPYKTKFPPSNRWHLRTITIENVHKFFFENSQQNIGVQLGPKSNNLTDADLDCPEAVKLASALLPKTDCIFGRKSKPFSHYLYRVSDPLPQATLAYKDEEGKMICELRLGGGGKGAQTMFPGSMHPDDEPVKWEKDGEPARATCAALHQACTRIAVGTMLMRAWPARSGRHDAALRIGGFLARAGWDGEAISNFVGIVANAVGDEECRDRERAARDAFEEHSRGGNVAGLPKLIDLLGEEVAKQIAKLVEYREADTGELLERMNESYCVVPINGKVRVMAWEQDEGEVRQTPVFYSFLDFGNLHNHKRVTEKQGEGTWWLYNRERRQYGGLVFRPGQSSIVGDKLNLWRGWAINPQRGSWRRLRRHIYEVLANKDKKSFKYIIKWVAWALQNPDKQAEVALVFHGGRGTGRGMFGRMLVDIFGQHGWHIASREHFVGRFNAHLMYCAMLFVDEAYWPGDKQGEGILKNRVTEGTLTVEPKGIDPMRMPNRLKVIIASNEKWIVPAGVDERRFAVFNVSEKYKQKTEYFVPLYAEMESGGIAAMMHDLLAMDLRGWHPRKDVPKTEALREQQERSLSPEEHWWLSLLHNGELPGPEHKKPIPSSNPRVRADYAPGNQLLATSAALLEHARESNIRLKQYFNEHLLARFLKEHGCDRDCDWRIDGKRAWRFPPLKEARKAWDERIGATTRWEPEPVEGEARRGETWTHSEDF